MVLKSSIRTLALPWRQQSEWGLRVTQNAYFSLKTHTKQLLFLTLCDTVQELDLVFRHMETRAEPEPPRDGQMDIEVEIVI